MILDFYFIKALYIEDEDFKVVEDPSTTPPEKRISFFKKNKLCIPKGPLRDLIVKEAHGGALVGHFGINKILEILKDHFCWVKIGEDFHKVITWCATCCMAKSHFH